VASVPAAALEAMGELEMLRIAQTEPGEDRRRAAAREQLVARYRGMVWSCAGRYRARSSPGFEDLVQEGYAGLMKAITRFDPAVGQSLGAYAQVMISGEMLRSMRDDQWPVHVPRPDQEIALASRAAAADLAAEFGRAPAVAEVAARLGVTAGTVRRARLAGQALGQYLSLDTPLSGEKGDATFGDTLGGGDPRIEVMLGLESVAEHWDELTAREKVILVLRFRDDLTQWQIGEQLGCSQMQVSRHLRHALGRLRLRVEG
jgi:RNA polymerase sigma-B factor